MLTGAFGRDTAQSSPEARRGDAQTEHRPLFTTARSDLRVAKPTYPQAVRTPMTTVKYGNLSWSITMYLNRYHDFKVRPFWSGAYASTSTSLPAWSETLDLHPG